MVTPAYNEVIRAHTRNAGFTCTSPSHQLARQGTQAQRKAQETNRCWIRESSSQVPLDFVLRAQVDLLEELRANGDGVGGADLPQSLLAGVVTVELVRQ